MVITFPSAQLSSSICRFLPVDAASEEILLIHMLQSSCVVPSYFGMAANSASYFLHFTATASVLKALACCLCMSPLPDDFSVDGLPSSGWFVEMQDSSTELCHVWFQ